MLSGELLLCTALAILLPLGGVVILGALALASFWKPLGTLGSPDDQGRELCVAATVAPSGFEMLSHSAVMRRWQFHLPVESRMLGPAAEAADNYLFASSQG